MAEQHLVVPGLRAGHYLCFFGIHALTPAVMHLLDAELRASAGQAVSLSPSLAELARREKYLALELAGRRSRQPAPARAGTCPMTAIACC